MVSQQFDEIRSVIDGKVILLQEVPDEMFSQEMMGKGLAIEPVGHEIRAPFDGEVVSVFPTGHALTVRSKKGCELLIHIGIDTVRLKGQYFEPKVTEGELIKAGQLLLTFEKDKIEAAGYATVVPIVILNTTDYERIENHEVGTIQSGELVIGLVKKSLDQLTSETVVESSEHHKERAIITALGGPENIRTITHCATRLRVTFIDEKKVDRKGLEKISGVLGVVEAMGGLQIVIGNTVNDTYDKICRLYHFTNLDGESASESKSRNIISRVLNVLADVLGPITPLIMGSGLLSAALVLLARLGIDESDSTYVLLNMAANVVFYFLPIVLAYSSAKRFGTDVIYSLFIGGLLLHPTLISMVTDKTSMNLFGLPVTGVNYSSSLIPIIISVWILSYVEKFINRYLPKSLRYVIKPLAIILIIAPITLIVTGPAGYILGEGLGWVITLLQTHAEWLAILILCSIAPFLVMTGMHIALTPIIILTNLENLGYENILLVAFIGMNFSQFAVSMATFFKTKNKTLKTLALSCGLTAFFGGVTEPTLYGISVKLKRPLYASFIGCFANALCCIFLNIKIFTFSAPSFFSLPIFMNPDGMQTNFISALITIAVVIVVTFVATWVLGFDDSVYDE